MSPHDMIKKKTKEVEAQAGPVEIQRKREEAMFVQSITRQYEEARKQETKLARQLRQGPPDSVIKKSRWSSKKKRALDELSKQRAVWSVCERGRRSSFPDVVRSSAEPQ